MNKNKRKAKKIASRNDLIAHFSKGNLPNEEHFELLINSNYNKADDNLDIDDKDGLMLYPTNNGRLLNFFESGDDDDPKYGIRISDGGLSFVGDKVLNNQDSEKQDPHLFIKESGDIGIGNKTPKETLDVSGIIASDGRIGNIQGELPADGKWYNVFGKNNLYKDKEKLLTGVNAFEILAYARGEVKKGRYSLLHAIITSTWGRSKITKTTSRFGRKSNKIDIRCVCRNSQIEDGIPEDEKTDEQLKASKSFLRKIKRILGYFWEKKEHSYNLQLRTKSNYGSPTSEVNDIAIFYSISVLWHSDFFNRLVKEGLGDSKEEVPKISKGIEVNEDTIQRKLETIEAKENMLDDDRRKLEKSLNDFYSNRKNELQKIKEELKKLKN